MYSERGKIVAVYANTGSTTVDSDAVVVMGTPSVATFHQLTGGGVVLHRNPVVDMVQHHKHIGLKHRSLQVDDDEVIFPETARRVDVAGTAQHQPVVHTVVVVVNRAHRALVPGGSLGAGREPPRAPRRNHRGSERHADDGESDDHISSLQENMPLPRIYATHST